MGSSRTDRHGPNQKTSEKGKEVLTGTVPVMAFSGDFSKGLQTRQVRDQRRVVRGPPASELDPGGTKPNVLRPSLRPPLPPELVSSKDVCLLILAPVEGGIHTFNIRRQPQAGQRLGVPSLQGTG